MWSVRACSGPRRSNNTRRSLARLTIFGEAKGFTIGSKASVWDSGGGLRFHVNRNIYLSVSYRAIDYDIDWFDVIVDTRFHGPYIGAGLRF